MPLLMFLGSMFSGKTLSGLTEITKENEMGKKCLIINSARDTRESKSGVSSHSKLLGQLPESIDTVKSEKLADVDVSKYDVVFVDEGQFFGDLEETVCKWLLLGIMVIISALDGDAEQKPFGQVHLLLCKATDYVKCKAWCVVCNTGGVRNYAPFTKKIAGGRNTVDIGGKDKYIPVCEKCLRK